MVKRATTLPELTSPQSPARLPCNIGQFSLSFIASVKPRVTTGLTATLRSLGVTQYGVTGLYRNGIVYPIRQAVHAVARGRPKCNTGKRAVSTPAFVILNIPVHHFGVLYSMSSISCTALWSFIPEFGPVFSLSHFQHPPSRCACFDTNFLDSIPAEATACFLSKNGSD